MNNMAEKVSELLQKLIKGIMDCLENCVGSMTFCVGQRVLKVFILSGVLLGVVLICQVFGIWTFVSWQEALSCICISGGLSMVDATNRAKLTKFSKKLKGGQCNGQ